MSFHEDMLREWSNLEVRPQYDTWLEQKVLRLQKVVEAARIANVWLFTSHNETDRAEVACALNEALIGLDEEESSDE